MRTVGILTSVLICGLLLTNSVVFSEKDAPAAGPESTPLGKGVSPELRACVQNGMAFLVGVQDQKTGSFDTSHKAAATSLAGMALSRPLKLFGSASQASRLGSDQTTSMPRRAR